MNFLYLKNNPCKHLANADVQVCTSLKILRHSFFIFELIVSCSYLICPRMTFPNTWDGGTLDILFSSNHMNFYECCDLTKKVFLGYTVRGGMGTT